MTAEPRTRVLLVLVLWLTGLGAAGQYAKVSVVFARLSMEYDAAPALLGLIVSAVGVVGIAFGAFAGAFVGRIGYRRALLLCVWSGAALSVLQAMLPPLAPMLTLRLLEGASHLGIVVIIPTLIAQYSSDRHRGFTLTLWSTFFSIAFSLLVVFGLPLADAHGIGALFLAHGVWMVAAAVVLTFMIPKPDPAAQIERKPLKFWRDMARLYASPYVAAPGVGWLFYTLVFLSILTLLPQILPPDITAFVIGWMPIISIVVSLTLGVWLMRFMGAFGVLCLGFAVSAGTTLGLAVLPGSIMLCFVLAGGLGLVQGASFAAVPELNTTLTDRARANGAMAQMGNLGNTLGTPLMAAILMAAGARGMMIVCASVLFLGLLVHLWLRHLRLRTGIHGNP